MSFFSTLSATLLAPAEEGTSNEGKPTLEIKALNAASNPGIPVLLVVDRDTDNAKFLKELSQKASTGAAARVLVSGVLQLIPAEQDKGTKEITKKPKVILFVGSARRLRADTKIEPEQAVVFGSGFASPQTVFGSDQRKAELSITSGNESLVEEGRWASRVTVLGDASVGTDELTLTCEDGQEVFFMGNLFRNAGEVNGTEFDKLKVNLSFAQASDRMKKKGGGARRPKAASMNSQLGDSFESTESATTTLSADDLAAQANVSLADF